ncbi:hypothetical protein BJF93_17590 [Xaviernesmea oryzae]|uniref:SHOCT domain-containing protein n=1 Tax=Xaviernesmea oryzae TaxID=464029 RepID=A0A1Q9AT87_9HYPH|nr:SHOCT domain-containing protein [Xaviernesmea oryzae]OLP58650.1 hypothetical protein BJF93_17590 [Xaviernesmea oryzae]SEK65688.1 Short C-terminal domain-containing protein [Xaviernesmea oryzae]
MQGFPPETEAFLSDLARQFHVSDQAVRAMLDAVRRGQGSMAQFDISELGGNGQWMLGGMTMVGDMFNHTLKANVDGLCNALSMALANGQIATPWGGQGQSGAWWPAELGQPSSSGGQNDSAYAVFPMRQRLAIREGDVVTLYDTGAHLIGGVSQQQGSGQSLSFSSQLGTFPVSSLRRVDAPSAAAPAEQAAVDVHHAEPAPAPQAASASPQRAASSPAAASPPSAARVDAQEILGLIEKLASLRDAGILSDEEFATKKTELLARL